MSFLSDNFQCNEWIQCCYIDSLCDFKTAVIQIALYVACEKTSISMYLMAVTQSMRWIAREEGTKNVSTREICISNAQQNVLFFVLQRGKVVSWPTVHHYFTLKRDSDMSSSRYLRAMCLSARLLMFPRNSCRSLVWHSGWPWICWHANAVERRGNYSWRWSRSINVGWGRRQWGATLSFMTLPVTELSLRPSNLGQFPDGWVPASFRRRHRLKSEWSWSN